MAPMTAKNVLGMLHANVPKQFGVLASLLRDRACFSTGLSWQCCTTCINIQVEGINLSLLFLAGLVMLVLLFPADIVVASCLQV